LISGLFDSHCHLDDAKFDLDRPDVIGRMQHNGIVACVTVGSDLVSSQRCLDIAGDHEDIYAAVGVHPHEAKEAPADYLLDLENMLNKPKVVALGEIGLDYHYDFSPRETQAVVFSEQLDLAYRHQLPVIVHVREAHGDVLKILRERSPKLSGGIIHCFSGSAQSGREYMALGFYISFAGSVTFKNASKLKEAALAVPFNRLLIETDSPYLSPEPKRGKRNEPANVKYICEALALLRGTPYEQMAYMTAQNARDVFAIQL
jgi:TatD DNase family protein